MSEGRQFIVETLDAQGSVVGRVGVSGFRVVASRVTGTTAGAASSMRTYGGNGQSGAVGQAIAIPPSVQVVDGAGLPVAGSTVTWLPGGGSGVTSTGNTSTTNSNGVATVGSWTMGTVTGSGSSYSLLAYSGALQNSPIGFVVTSIAPGSAFSMAISGGTSQTSTPLGTLPSLLSVLVTDQYGNATSNATLTVTTNDPDAVVGASTITTNASGVAGVSYTVGQVASTYSVNIALSSTVSSYFTSITTSGSARSLTLTGGNNQTAQSSTTLPITITGTVDDGFGNPIGSGVTIQYVIVTGSGNLSRATQTPVASAWSVDWKTGAATGQQRLEISLANVSNSTITVSASATSPNADTIAIESGNSQTGTVGQALALPLAVVCTGSGTSSAGQIVTWTISSSNNTGSLSTDRTVSSATGVARTVLTLGTIPSVFTVQASAGTLAGSPLFFVATAQAGSATSLVLSTQPTSNTQAGVAWPQQPVVVSTDVYGNLVSTNTRVQAVLFGTPTPNGTLGSGISTFATASGATASFSGLSYNGSGAFQTVYRCNSLSTATATQQNGAPPFASKLAFTVQPSSVLTGGTFSPTVQVAVQDSNGVTVTTDTSAVALAISGAGVLTGSTTTNAVAGIASFPGLGVSNACPVGSYTLAASDTGLTGATSAAFAVTAGGSDYPNKPAGLTTIGEFSCNKTNAEIGDYPVGAVSGVTGQMAVNGNTNSLLVSYGITDPTAPYGADQVRRIRYSASSFNGTGPANMALWKSATNINSYNTLYICYVWNFVGNGSGTFEFHASVTKQFWPASGTAGDSSNYFCVPGNGSQTPRSQYKYELRQQGAFSGQCNRPQNGGGGSYQHTVGHWYRTEMLCVMNNPANNSGGHAIYGGSNITLGDGLLRVWEQDLTAGETSSTTLMDYSDLCWKDAGTNNRNFKFHYWNGTYGGGAATKTQSDDIYIARICIAAV